MANEQRPVPRQPQGLVDILDKILDKGLVVAGDIKISLANVELLTIQLRLIVCSIDKAEAIGLNWWRGERFYSADAPRDLASNDDVKALRDRLSELEKRLGAPRDVPGARARARKEGGER